MSLSPRHIRLIEEIQDLRAEIARLAQGEAPASSIIHQALRLVELEARADEWRRMATPSPR